MEVDHRDLVLWVLTCKGMVHALMLFQQDGSYEKHYMGKTSKI